MQDCNCCCKITSKYCRSVRWLYVTWSSFDLWIFIFWLIQGGWCLLWGFTGFASPLCKTTHTNTSPHSTTSTQTLTQAWLRADVRQEQRVESYSPYNVTRPLLPGMAPRQLKAALVMSWMKVCECLIVPTSTDSDVCPFSPPPSLSPFLHPTCKTDGEQ